MKEGNTKADADGTALFAKEAWFDPVEAGIWERVRGFIEQLIEQNLNGAGTRAPLLGRFGPVAPSVPRAQMTAKDGGAQE